MRHVNGWRGIVAFVVVITITANARAAEPLPMLHADGPNLVDLAGKTVVLKGCNLGNYLMFEGWMFGGTLQQAGKGIRDGVTYDRALRKRFGDDKAEKLFGLYRQGWITPRDFEQIKAYGFNVVRLPFDYRLIQDDAPPYKIRPDAFRWLDHAVDMAEAAGVYTILDLHGVPGGQSREDHTGEAGQNHLWDDETCQRRTVDVWRAVAGHFKGRASVAAYDLMNEPYGDHKQDVRPVLKKLMPQITRTIRDLGDTHVVYFPAPLTGGVGFYGDPHTQDLTNVAFTEHFYPGLFGGKPGMEPQARLLNVTLPANRDQMRNIASPYLIGEFNVVLEQNGSDRMMRAYFDRAAEYGWQATMWSYKLLKRDGGSGPNSWYLVTNAQPLPTVDIDTCTYNEIETFLGRLATMPLARHASLHDMLTRPTPPPLDLPDVRPAATSAESP